MTAEALTPEAQVGDQACTCYEVAVESGSIMDERSWRGPWSSEMASGCAGREVLIVLDLVLLLASFALASRL